MKGEYLQICNRTVCSNPLANFFNHSTKKFYCIECAKMINDANRRDAIRMFGHELCTIVKSQDEAETISN